MYCISHWCNGLCCWLFYHRLSAVGFQLTYTSLHWWQLPITIFRYGLIFKHHNRLLELRRTMWEMQNLGGKESCSGSNGGIVTPIAWPGKQAVCNISTCKISNRFPCRFCLTPLLNTKKRIYLPAAYCPRMLSFWINGPIIMSKSCTQVWHMPTSPSGSRCVWACWHATAKPVAEHACATKHHHQAVMHRGDVQIQELHRRGLRCHSLWRWNLCTWNQWISISWKIQQERRGTALKVMRIEVTA